MYIKAVFKVHVYGIQVSCDIPVYILKYLLKLNDDTHYQYCNFQNKYLYHFTDIWINIASYSSNMTDGRMKILRIKVNRSIGPSCRLYAGVSKQACPIFTRMEANRAKFDSRNHCTSSIRCMFEACSKTGLTTQYDQIT